MTQNTLILSHLKHAPITSLEAFKLYGITRLASRIHELREKHNIIGRTIIAKNGKRWTQYKLKGK